MEDTIILTYLTVIFFYKTDAKVQKIIRKFASEYE